MDATPSDIHQRNDGVPAGLLALLIDLAKAVSFPFDAVLCGMVGAGLCIDALCEFLDLTRAKLDDHIVRLGLQTPNDRPARRRGPTSWSVEQTRQLIVLRMAGIHPECIGQVLCRRSPNGESLGPRSASAIRAKARRLGLPCPPRKDLFRPSREALARLANATLGESAPSSAASTCGRAAGPVSFTLEPTSAETRAAVKRERGPARQGRTPGQRELKLFGVVASAERSQPVAREPEPAVARFDPNAVPASTAEVDFTNLSWVGRLKRPRSSEVLVWTLGMLAMGGLHWKAAANLVGMTQAAFRTLRSRVAVPSDLDRKNYSTTFDLDVAKATLERNGYVVRQQMRSDDRKPLFFWVKKTDRGTRFAPTHRKRDEHEPRYSTMKIVTRKTLDVEARVRVPPFARVAGNISAR